MKNVQNQIISANTRIREKKEIIAQTVIKIANIKDMDLSFIKTDTNGNA